MNMVFADMGFDHEGDSLAGARQLGQRTRGAEDQIADAAHIDHRPVVADGIQNAGQLGDHAGCPNAAWPNAAWPRICARR